MQVIPQGSSDDPIDISKQEEEQLKSEVWAFTPHNEYPCEYPFDTSPKQEEDNLKCEFWACMNIIQNEYNINFAKSGMDRFLKENADALQKKNLQGFAGPEFLALRIAIYTADAEVEDIIDPKQDPFSAAVRFPKKEEKLYPFPRELLQQEAIVLENKVRDSAFYAANTVQTMFWMPEACADQEYPRIVGLNASPLRAQMMPDEGDPSAEEDIQYFTRNPHCSRFATGHLDLSRFKGICCMEFVRGAADSLLSNGFHGNNRTASVIEVAWLGVRWCYYCDLLVEMVLLLLVIALSPSLRADRPETKPNFALCCIIAAFVAKLTVDELMQLYLETKSLRLHSRVGDYCEFNRAYQWSEFSATKKKRSIEIYLVMEGLMRYLFVSMNVLDIAMLVLEIYCSTLLFTAESSQGEVFFSIWALVRWAKVTTLLRGLQIFGVSFMPILSTLKASLPMLCCTGAAVAAFTHVLFILAPRSDAPDHLYSSWLLTFRLAVLGDFDRFEMEGTDPVYVQSGGESPLTMEPSDPEPTRKFWSVQAWFLATGIIVQVLLLQLFVGVLGSNYDLHQSQARAIFTKDRARMICRLSQRVWYRHRVNKFFVHAKGKIVGFVEFADEESEETTSVRSAITNSKRGIQADISKIDKDIVKIKEKVNEDITEIKERVCKVDKDIGEMKAMLGEMQTMFSTSHRFTVDRSPAVDSATEPRLRDVSLDRQGDSQDEHCFNLNSNLLTQNADNFKPVSAFDASSAAGIDDSAVAHANDAADV